MSFNGINDHGLVTLLTSILKGASMSLVNLWGNHFGEQGGAALKKCIELNCFERSDTVVQVVDGKCLVALKN